MNKKRLLGICLIFLIVAFIFIQPAYAGPGGQVAKAMAQTFWGKMVLGLLSMVLLPIGIYLFIKQQLAQQRAYRDLQYMAQYDPNFEWQQAKERIIDCFYRVHRAWRTEDISEVSEVLTDWYWQNQQLVRLDKWHKQGVYNVCDVKKIRTIRPLLFVHRNADIGHGGSLLVVSITANMKNYLARRGTDIVVAGDKRYKDHETIWSFALVDGQWRVSNIEEARCEFEYVFQIKNLPKIESTILGREAPD
jgi:Tim44-like domain